MFINQKVIELTNITTDLGMENYMTNFKAVFFILSVLYTEFGGVFLFGLKYNITIIVCKPAVPIP